MPTYNKYNKEQLYIDGKPAYPSVYRSGNFIKTVEAANELECIYEGQQQDYHFTGYAYKTSKPLEICFCDVYRSGNAVQVNRTTVETINLGTDYMDENGYFDIILPSGKANQYIYINNTSTIRSILSLPLPYKCCNFGMYFDHELYNYNSIPSNQVMRPPKFSDWSSLEFVSPACYMAMAEIDNYFVYDNLNSPISFGAKSTNTSTNRLNVSLIGKLPKFNYDVFWNGLYPVPGYYIKSNYYLEYVWSTGVKMFREPTIRIENISNPNDRLRYDVYGRGPFGIATIGRPRTIEFDNIDMTNIWVNERDIYSFADMFFHDEFTSTDELERVSLKNITLKTMYINSRWSPFLVPSDDFILEVDWGTMHGTDFVIGQYFSGNLDFVDDNVITIPKSEYYGISLQNAPVSSEYDSMTVNLNNTSYGCIGWFLPYGYIYKSYTPDGYESWVRPHSSDSFVLNINLVGSKVPYIQELVKWYTTSPIAAQNHLPYFDNVTINVNLENADPDLTDAFTLSKNDNYGAKGLLGLNGNTITYYRANNKTVQMNIRCDRDMQSNILTTFDGYQVLDVINWNII